MPRLLLSLAVLLPLAIVGCAADQDASPSSPTESDEADLKKAPDGSHTRFLGKWTSAITDVPEVGDLPFESNIRSLEFKSTRDDSSSYVRYRMIEVVRPSCDTCRDETISEGTYRSIAASASSLNKGKVYVTEGGNNASRFFYELDGDVLKLTATGLGADSRTVVREFKRAP